MICYAEAKVFPLSVVADFYRATRLVNRLSAYDPTGDWVRCHELARAISPLLLTKWEVVDGKYGPCEHSWLMNDRGVILDVYAVARLPQVQLIDGLWPGNYKRFRREEPRTDIKHGVVRWLAWLMKKGEPGERDTEPPRPNVENEGGEDSSNQGDVD